LDTIEDTCFHLEGVAADQSPGGVFAAEQIYAV